MASGRHMRVAIAQIVAIMVPHTQLRIFEKNGCTMTRYRSTAMAVEVKVDTYTETPIVKPRTLQRNCGSTQVSENDAIGVNGAATKLMRMSDTARLVMKRLVIDCIDLQRRMTRMTIVLPRRLRTMMTP